MKSIHISIILLLSISILFLPTAFSEDYMYWGLPEDVKIRLGKGRISGNIAFSPDNKILAVASATGVWFYDGNTGEELNLFTNHSKSITSIAFSPDGTTLASGTTGDVYLWDVTTGEHITIQSAHVDEISSIVYNPNGNIIATCGNWDDETIKLWDATTGELINTLSGHQSNINSITFSPDGETLISGGYGRGPRIKFWDVATGELMDSIINPYTNVISMYIAISPDGRKIANGTGRWKPDVYLWDIATGTSETLKGHMDGVKSVAFSPDGNLLASGSDDGMICLWDTTTLIHNTTLIRHYDTVVSLTFSPDGKTLASGSEDGTIILWDTENLKQKTVITEHNNWGSDIDYSPDGQKIVAGYGDRTLRLWDTTSGKLTRTISGHNGGVISVSFNPDGQTVASSENISYIDLVRFEEHIVNLWDITTGAIRLTLFGHNDDVYFLRFSPKGNMLITSDRDGKVVLWDTATGNSLWTLHIDKEDYINIAFSPDGNILATGGRSHIHLWNIVSRQLISTFSGSFHWGNRMLFSPDGQTLATVRSGNDVQLWDIVSGESETIFTEHSGRYACSIDFSSDGETIITAGYEKDETIRFWDTKSLELIAMLSGLPNGINSIDVSPDGNTLATLGRGGPIYLWDIESIVNPAKPEADVDGDGEVNIHDLIIVAANFGQTGPNPADVNGDGVVDISDLIKVAAAIEAQAAGPSATLFNNKFLPTRSDVQEWLTQAQNVNLANKDMQKGILFLERLLLALTPKQTALLPNYPNPFNPETWIPYQLSESTDVSIKIYSTDGQLIRTLEIGQKTAGLYQKQSHAAYWDGKNEFGEPVASGVYFYTLIAGEFTATRKMQILK